jgi:soluble lytic murein transglycosylase-like protein
VVACAVLAVGCAQARAQTIVLPDSVPAQCVVQAADRYDVPEILLVSIIKYESGGRPDAVNHNTDGSLDIGLGQFNTHSWVPYLQKHYGISPSALMGSPCQAIMAQSFVLRKIADTQCQGQVLWCAVGYYHSPTPRLQRQYIAAIYGEYQKILRKGHF